MPLTATLENRILFARDVTDRAAFYKCKHCEARMTLKRGEIKAPHFAHVAYNSCPFYKPESEMHFKMKEWVRSQLPNAELEVRIGNTIFDVKCGDCVIECQASQLSISEYRQRVKCAEENNLELFWVLAIGTFGKTMRDIGFEYARLKALELEISDMCIGLFYLEFHTLDNRMIAFTRDLTEPKISPGNEWNNYNDIECKTIWRFNERAGIELKELVL